MTAPTAEQAKLIEKAVALMKSEAEEFTKQTLLDPMKTTKDNYAKVMAFLSQLPAPMNKLFLVAMTRVGYPKDTAIQITQIMGW